MIQKYSLFAIEKRIHFSSCFVGEFGSTLTESCFEYLDTFDTLEEAQKDQKEWDVKTLILPSY